MGNFIDRLRGTREGNNDNSASPTIEIVPYEILIQIIGHVPIAHWGKLERVSQTFRSATSDAWKKLETVHIHDELLLGHVHSNTTGLPDRFPRHKSLNVILDGLLERAPNLRAIEGLLCPIPLHTRYNVDMEPMTDDTLDRLARFEKLDRIKFDAQSLDQRGLRRFLMTSSSRGQLKAIDACWAFIQTSREPNGLTEAFSNETMDIDQRPLRLETIKIENCRWWNVSFEFLPAVDVSNLSSFMVDGTTVPMKLLADFLERANHLQRLSFHFDCCYDECKEHDQQDRTIRTMLATNNRILRAIGNMDRLKSLTLDGRKCKCRNLDSDLVDLFRSIGQREILEDLNFGMDIANTQLIEAIAPMLPNLKSLSLHVENISKAALKSILRSQLSLRRLQLYDSLSLDDVKFDAADIIDHSNLESLTLGFPRKQVPTSDLLKLHHLSKLRSFRLCTKGDNVGDLALEAWAEGFGSTLRKFVLQDCRNVTNQGVVAFLKHAPNLRVLSLSNCYLNDVGLREIASLHPTIEKLILLQCDGVSLIGLQRAINEFDRLKNVFLSPDKIGHVRHVKVGKYRTIYFYCSGEESS